MYIFFKFVVFVHRLPFLEKDFMDIMYFEIVFFKICLKISSHYSDDTSY